jgi:hypothetical protein
LHFLEIAKKKQFWELVSFNFIKLVYKIIGTLYVERKFKVCAVPLTAFNQNQLLMNLNVITNRRSERAPLKR